MTLTHPYPQIYLNNAATSWPKPPEVIKRIEESLSVPFSGGGRGVKTSCDYVSSARERVADLFKVPDPDHIIFTHNATDALNTVIQGFTAGKKDPFHVISTDLDHNAIIRPLNELSRKHLMEVTYLPQKDGYIDPDQVLKAIQPDTRLAVMTQGSNVIGTVQDIATIGKILQDEGIFVLIDGAQTAGHIPIRLDTLPVDAFVFTGHKGLFGIPGTGGFFIRDPEPVQPTRYGGTGSNSSYPYQPEDLPERFEAGTHNFPGLAALSAGIEYISSVGIDAIEQKGRNQSAYLVKSLQENESITIQHHTPDLPLISCTIAGIDPEDLGFILARIYRIIVRTGLHCAPRIHSVLDGGIGSVRMSLSWFTTDEECRIASEALIEIADTWEKTEA